MNTTLPVKRQFDDNNSLKISNKKSKTSLNINKKPGKSADNSFSMLRKELASLKKSFAECNGQQVEERRLRSIKRDIEKCCEELENMETQVKEFETEKNILDGQVNEFESKKGELEGLLRDFESEKTNFERRQKEFESKEKEFEIRVMEFQSKEEEFKVQVKVLFEAKEEKFEVKMQQFENQVEDNLKSVKALELKENQIEVQIKDLKSKLNNFGGQPKELELTEKQHDEEKEFDTSYMDDDGASEEIDILDNLRESSDPAKIVLDIILNPIIPLPKKGDKAVIIDDESRIYLLEKLMTISPNIKPCVRDEALKLARELKANMKENTENYLEVLGFLLILSIYGLHTYFDEDEV
ncbi:putative transcription factor bZIP family [Medicago truncatula]|uniref:FRIGIDA-like protein n=2 Tax=Medicago truncatula TaxID=3880 RepID=G7IUV7_MEDTR|nr:uncharacterized protein LOC11430694 [Medicago truncatula]AES68136.2 frigida-LIKE protein [Medicago truncatula]RHN76513.1 putative transcription factor bZIP family [Medicago truncatula]